MKERKHEDVSLGDVDYTKLIGEIRVAIMMRDLNYDDKVQILRAENAVTDDGYKPIVEYYYNHGRIIEMLEPSPALGESELDRLNQLRGEYEANRPLLETVTVIDMLNEMETFARTAARNDSTERKPASKLAELRQKVGLTQRVAAEKLSVDLRTYQRYEWGEIALGDVTGYRLLQLAKLFNVTVDFLLSDTANEQY